LLRHRAQFKSELKQSRNRSINSDDEEEEPQQKKKKTNEVSGYHSSSSKSSTSYDSDTNNLAAHAQHLSIQQYAVC